MENITEEQSSSSPFTSLERKGKTKNDEQFDCCGSFLLDDCGRHCTDQPRQKKRSVTKIRMLKRFAIPYSEIVSATGEDEDNNIINLDISKSCAQEHEHSSTSARSVLQAPGIRIQLHLHRPLKWHVTATTTPTSKEIHVHGRAYDAGQLKADEDNEDDESGDDENEEDDLGATDGPEVRLLLTPGDRKSVV